MVDIDQFKNYNDTLGHSDGDECLKTIANILNHSVKREGDFVARYGGEEFIIVLPNTDKAGAIIVAETILENIKTANIPHTSSCVADYVTVSMGIVSDMASYTTSPIDYIKRADEALYISKENGRNRFTITSLQ